MYCTFVLRRMKIFSKEFIFSLKFSSWKITLTPEFSPAVKKRNILKFAEIFVGPRKSAVARQTETRIRDILSQKVLHKNRACHGSSWSTVYVWLLFSQLAQKQNVCIRSNGLSSVFMRRVRVTMLSWNLHYR